MKNQQNCNTCFVRNYGNKWEEIIVEICHLMKTNILLILLWFALWKTAQLITKISEVSSFGQNWKISSSTKSIYVKNTTILATNNLQQFWSKLNKLTIFVIGKVKLTKENQFQRCMSKKLKSIILFRHLRYFSQNHQCRKYQIFSSKARQNLTSTTWARASRSLRDQKVLKVPNKSPHCPHPPYPPYPH